MTVLTDMVIKERNHICDTSSIRGLKMRICGSQPDPRRSERGMAFEPGGSNKGLINRNPMGSSTTALNLQGPRQHKRRKL